VIATLRGLKIKEKEHASHQNDGNLPFGRQNTVDEHLFVKAGATHIFLG
jgi:hypothetical protein